jgi:hypothetical protein
VGWWGALQALDAYLQSLSAMWHDASQGELEDGQLSTRQCVSSRRDAAGDRAGSIPPAGAAVFDGGAPFAVSG